MKHIKTKNVVNWTLVFMIVVGLASVLIIREAGATGGRDDPDVTAEAEADAQAEADASADSSSESSAQADASNGDQTINFTGPSEVKTTGRAYLSSGDATADCQKFGGVSSAWLGGALGLGINWTDKECRQLKVYDRLVDRGLLLVANKALCDTRTLRKLYGKGGGGQCAAELGNAYNASQGAQDDIRNQVAELRRLVRELSVTSSQAPQGAKTGETAGSVHNVPPQDAQDGRSTYAEYPSNPGNTADCKPCPDCSEQATRAFQACVAK